MAKKSLAEYRRKRRFERTPEPTGQAERSATGRTFVIQKHAASRLHYDFRLEMDGALKSWAVPKGPSLDPAEKRLAVEVEDHPVEYGTFEGLIPAGEYGGGTVMLWDRGWWELKESGVPINAWKSGRMKFTLHGEKLQGGWNLVRMAGRGRGGAKEKRQWLLIKERDEFAQPLTRGDVLENDRSVESGRTMDEIAQQKKRSWRGTRKRKPSSTRARRAKSGGEGVSLATNRRPAEGKGPMRAALSERLASLAAARKSAQPKFLSPQLATLVAAPPEGDDWLHEIKLDGYRMLLFKRGESIRMLTRRGNDWHKRFPAIVAAAAELPIKNAILDGEVVIQTSGGVTSFQALQNLLEHHQKKGELLFYAFDLPWCEGYDLRNVPLSVRKAILADIVGKKSRRGRPIRYSDHIAGGGDKVFQHACRLKLEGIISKKSDSAYESRRARSWVKVKCTKRQEFIIGGFTDPEGARSGFGALLLGYYDNGDIRYAGKVGTGFNEATLRDLGRRLRKIERSESPFADMHRGRGVHWVEPILVGEVEFTEWTNDGILRHPSFQGLRADKDPSEITRELPMKQTPISSASRRRGATPTGAPAKRTTSGDDSPDTVAGIRLSNPGRIFYAEQSITKLELARYYESIAHWVLPHVVHRPLSLVRCPQGRGTKCFYQKHITEASPETLHGVRIKEGGTWARYISIHDLAGLVSLVQMGVLEVHPWGSRDDDPEKPDRLIFDLDPDPAVEWDLVREGAQRVRETLEEAGMQSFLRTSGGKGLHVVAPIARRHSWDELKDFAHAVAGHISRTEPEKYLATMSKAKRKGRIFVDYLRNGRGATAVASYSSRAKPAAPVATPLRWDELKRINSADAFNIRTIPPRLHSLKSDPWEGFFALTQSITAKSKKAVGMK